MGADNSPVDAVEVPPLKPIAIPARLADTPANGPKYAVSVNNAAGEAVTVADPNATRAAVALMNVHAVTGGAACHWGGPAACAEIMAATHAIMFAAEATAEENRAENKYDTRSLGPGGAAAFKNRAVAVSHHIAAGDDQG